MGLLRATNTALISLVCMVVAGLTFPAGAQVPNLPQHVRTRIESKLRAQGIYVPSEGVFKVRIPRTDILARMAGQQVHPGFLP